jgi:hypothetical protein
MNTDETASSLIDRLKKAGGWPEPSLLRAILGHGVEAVELLRALIRGDAGEEADQAVISMGVDLLGGLADPAAALDILNLLRRFDDIDIVEAVRIAARSFGPELIEPALEIAWDRSLDSYPRSTATGIAIAAAGDDLVARSRVAEATREMLSDCLSRREEAVQEDIQMATLLVSDLADLADPLARALIDEAFQAEMVDGWIIAPEDVEEAYRRGGSTIESEPGRWLTEYEAAYEEHLARQSRRIEHEARGPIGRSLGSELASIIPPYVATVRNTTARPGRNDPCHCGSGKKYKKCHLLQDQA